MPYIDYEKRRIEKEAYEAGFDDGLRAARRDIGRDFGDRRPKKRSKPRKSNPWSVHLKRFKYRKKRKNETTQQYLIARTKSAKRKYKKKKGK
jgi:hypothetical protein|tara:strand:+ start:542 stop:817 length:276 start_codon:yes stop_codon:yes gene_type:complete